MIGVCFCEKVHFYFLPISSLFFILNLLQIKWIYQ